MRWWGAGVPCVPTVGVLCVEQDSIEKLAAVAREAGVQQHPAAHLFRIPGVPDVRGGVHHHAVVADAVPSFDVQVVQSSLWSLPRSQRVSVARNVYMLVLQLLRRLPRIADAGVGGRGGDGGDGGGDGTAPTPQQAYLRVLAGLMRIAVNGVGVADAAVRLAACQALAEVCRVGGSRTAGVAMRGLLAVLRGRGGAKDDKDHSTKKEGSRSRSSASPSTSAARAKRLSPNMWAGSVFAVACLHRAAQSPRHGFSFEEGRSDSGGLAPARVMHDTVALVFEAGRVTNQPVRRLGAWAVVMCAMSWLLSHVLGVLEMRADVNALCACWRSWAPFVLTVAGVHVWRACCVL